MYIRDLLALVSVLPSVPLSRPGKLYSSHGSMSLDQESVTSLEKGGGIDRRIGDKVIMTSRA